MKKKKKYIDNNNVDLLEIEVATFECRKIFYRLMTDIHCMAILAKHSRKTNFEFKDFGVYANLVSTYFDYIFAMAERINERNPLKKNDDSVEQKTKGIKIDTMSRKGST